MNQRAPIGFSQLIKRTWLDFTARKKLEGQTSTEIRAALNDFLSDEVSVGSIYHNSSRRKIISILLKVWVNVPQPQQLFRDEGLLLFKDKPENIAVHWGMAMAVYPFFALVAKNVGRLLRLQNHVSMAQLHKRLREKMGERDTVIAATRKLIRCWVEWGVLADTDKKGIYTATDLQPITDVQLTTWLLEAALIANEGQSAVLHTLVNYTPTLFPFTLSSDYFIPNERLEMFNQGVSEISVTFSNYQPKS